MRVFLDMKTGNEGSTYLQRYTGYLAPLGQNNPKEPASRKHAYSVILSLPFYPQSFKGF